MEKAAILRDILYLSHPEVRIDPTIPVPDWGLNHVGRARAALLARSGRLTCRRRIVSSTERKAVETAEILSSMLGIPHQTREDLGENDRSATGFLPGPEFEAVADRFFAHPDISIRGWERAIDAQSRCVAALSQLPTEPLIVVGHGAVGTLAWCHATQSPISRRHDQLAGGGCVWRWTDLPPQPWRRLEDIIQNGIDSLCSPA